MSGLDHRRPLFKVMDAGGGERVRTIAEELRHAQIAERTGKPRAGSPRCGLCGSRREVTGHLQPRCGPCRTQQSAVRAARRIGATRSPQRIAGALCPRCRTELPATGLCGFCW